MKYFQSLVTVLLLSLVLVGCGNSDTQTQKTTDSETSNQPRAVKPDSDTLPLLPIMINLEQNMNALQAGIWREDYTGIKQAAEGIGNHAKIPKKQIQTIKSILGPDEFKQFVADDKTVHETALEIADAARNENLKKVTDLYGDLYQGCVSCHISHRSTIRNNPEWN